MTNKNRNYTASAIARLTKQEVWALPDGGLYVTYDDGVCRKVKTRATIYSWYYWKMFNEYGGQILPQHHVDPDPMTIDTPYTDSSHMDLASMVFWDCFFSNPDNKMSYNGQEQLWHMSRRIYQITNELYNDNILKLSSHVDTISLDSVMEILSLPAVMEAKRRHADREITVQEAHDIVYGTMTDSAGKLEYNDLPNGCRAKQMDRRQITQLIGPRGNIPDINGVAFNTPIDTGYVDGFDNTYDRYIEGRTASIALYMASGPLEASEYFSRQNQLACGVLSGVSYNDCGGKHTVPWKVRKNDLKYIEGKYHMVDGKPVLLKGDEKHLIGTTIQIRSICTCSSNDPSKPCAICLGFNAYVIPPGANLGHHLSIEPLSRISQTILSTKHVLSSTKSTYIEINGDDCAFIQYGEESNHHLRFTDEVGNGQWLLRIAIGDAMFLNDVHAVEDIDTLTPGRLSSCTEVELVKLDKNGNVSVVHTITTSVGGKGSPLSKEMLVFLKDNPWTIEADQIEIDLTEWDVTKPFIVSPRRGDDMMSILNITMRFLHCPVKERKSRIIDYATPGAAMMELLDLLSSKIHVNLSHVEVFIRSLMVREGDAGYGLPIAGEPFYFCPLKEVISRRSIGASFAFEGQEHLITSPASYLRLHTDIPGSPLDPKWG